MHQCILIRFRCTNNQIYNDIRTYVFKDIIRHDLYTILNSPSTNTGGAMKQADKEVFLFFRTYQAILRNM